jgi:hypothetical protein
MLGGADGRTLFMVVREWHGLSTMADRSRDGSVLVAEAPAGGRRLALEQVVEPKLFCPNSSIRLASVLGWSPLRHRSSRVAQG